MPSRKPTRSSNKPKSLTTAATPKLPETVFQFKITLLGIQPPIWRRVQVEDCTLDKLHEHIQTSMGWTNSHLHDFRIGEWRYGDPMLLQENFADMAYEDSTRTLLSDVVPRTGKPIRLRYQYDFGDSWEHQILFEKCVPPEPGCKYPTCLAGKRACPPEDCGGVWGYAGFLEAIGNKKHPEYRQMRDWIGGSFDPDEFDAADASKRMTMGLPDWRRMR